MVRVESELSKPNDHLVAIDFEKPSPSPSIDDAVQTARKAFNSGKTKTLKFRKEQLKALERFLIECEDEIVTAVFKDLRKHRQEVFMGEIDLIKHDLKTTLLGLKGWMKPDKPDTGLVNLLDGVYVYKDPYGVVLIIGAWNYPFMLLLQPFIGAIAGGNCAILKPSELAPESAKMISKYLPRYMNTECFQIITGGVEETTELLKNRFDYIFFTGSTYVGKIVHQAAAKFLTPTTLELGGKSPVFLDDSINMQIAAKRILWGKCLNSGQTCISPDYLLCSKETEQKFLEAYKNTICQFYGEDAKVTPFLSKIVTDRHYNRLMNFILKSEVALGGVGDPRQRVITPTVLINVKPDDDVMQEEIFGPILPILTVNSAQEAIDFINAREKPLALYVFSTYKNVREMFLKNTSSGALTVNDTIMHIWADGVPFGGVGASGMGGYHGKVGFDTFTHQKAVLIKGANKIIENVNFARYPPYSNFKAGILTFVTRKRRFCGLRWFKFVFFFLMGVAFTYCIQAFCR